MKAADQFHVGIVVADLDAALSRLTDLFGHEWADEIALPVEVRLPTGTETVQIRFRYSRTTPRLEVIEQRPGTVWTTADGSGIHHLGCWSDDLDADGAALAAQGYTLEAEGVDPAGDPMWSYWGGPDRPRIELVSRALEPMLALLWGAPA